MPSDLEQSVLPVVQDVTIKLSNPFFKSAERVEKEEELIKKFYSDKSSEENVKTDDSEENKNS